MKTCTGCHRTLELEEFYWRNDQGRYGSQCKECKYARSSAWRDANPALHAAAVKKRYNEFGRFDRYGITAEQYAAMLAHQHHRCALCKAAEPGGKGKWHIDHAHPTGESYHGFKATEGRVRGLLCHRCNQALGFYENFLERVGRESIEAYIQGA